MPTTRESVRGSCHGATGSRRRLRRRDAKDRRLSPPLRRRASRCRRDPDTDGSDTAAKIADVQTTDAYLAMNTEVLRLTSSPTASISRARRCRKSADRQPIGLMLTGKRGEMRCCSISL